MRRAGRESSRSSPGRGRELRTERRSRERKERSASWRPPSRQNVLATDRRGRDTKNPGSCGPGRRRWVAPRSLSRERSVTTSSRAGFLTRGYLLAGPSQELRAPSGILRLSVPLTVAGQRGFRTPFPFQPLRRDGEAIAHDAKYQGTKSCPIYRVRVALSIGMSGKAAGVFLHRCSRHRAL